MKDKTMIERYKDIALEIYEDGYLAGSSDIEKTAEGFAIIMYWIGKGRQLSIDKTLSTCMENTRYEDLKKEMLDGDNKK